MQRSTTKVKARYQQQPHFTLHWITMKIVQKHENIWTKKRSYIFKNETKKISEERKWKDLFKWMCIQTTCIMYFAHVKFIFTGKKALNQSVLAEIHVNHRHHRRCHTRTSNQKQFCFCKDSNVKLFWAI